jgi:hypothetical protein
LYSFLQSAINTLAEVTVAMSPSAGAKRGDKGLRSIAKGESSWQGAFIPDMSNGAYERARVTPADGGYHTAANLEAGERRGQTLVKPATPIGAPPAT